MPRQVIPLLTSTGYNKNKMYSATQQQLTNMYIETFPQDMSNRPNIAALPTPGFTVWKNLNGGQIRGMIQQKGYIYAVCDGTAYSINAITGISTTLGTLLTTSGRVIIDAIDDEVVFVEYNGANPGVGNCAVWSYRIAGATWQQVTQNQFTDYVSSVVGYSGYFLYLIQNSKTIFVSNLNDGRTIGALSFFSANSYSDNIIALTKSENFIYLFSDVGAEIWYLSGGVTVPFDRYPGGLVQFGIISPYAYTTILDQVYFMAQDQNGLLGPAIIQGPTAQLLVTPSTQQMNNNLIQKINNYSHNYDQVSWKFSSYSWAMNINGHMFFNTTFPLAEDIRGRTHSYDITNGTWIELQSFNMKGLISPTQDQHVANCHAYANNLQLIGDYYSGNIYKLDPNVYTENGTTITRQIVTRHLIDRDTLFSAYNLQIEVEKSQALDGSVQGSSPVLAMEYSKDWAHTWSPPAWRVVSEIGKYKTRARWSSLGGGRVFTIRLTMTDPINWTIVNGTLEIEREEPSYGRMIGLE